MTARIDHVALAGEFAEKAANPNATKTLTPVGIAQVHATLALVEQQRIANLIALAGMPKINGFENEVYDAATEALMEGLLDSETVAAVPGYGPAGIEQRVFIRPLIAEALGLS